MRSRWLVLLLLAGLLAGTPSATAEIIPISQFAPADTGLTLEPGEVEKLRQLQGATIPALLSPVSPDDSAIFTGTSRGEEVRLAFLNIRDGSTTPVENFLADLLPLSNIGWRDANTAIFIALDGSFEPVIAAIDRTTGTISTTPQELPGFPISLSPNGSRLLVAQEELEEEDVTSFSLLHSPFNRVIRRWPGQAEQSRLDAFTAQHEPTALSSSKVTLASLHLHTQELTRLVSLPEGSGLASEPAWSADGSRVALVRTTVPNITRGGTILSELIIQDTLGNLPPAENPFFQGNVVDVFNLASNDLRPAALQAAAGNGDIFARVAWSPDGQTLLTQMHHPSTLQGRTHPIYLYPDRSSYRFYDAATMQPTGTFDAAEVAAPNLAMPMFVAPGEVVFSAPFGLSHRLYYYNLGSQEFRQLSLWDGTYLQVRASHHSRQLVYIFSSYQHPPEIYRIGWDGSALAALSYHNIEREALNNIRVDPVSFTLSSGSVRNGYLLQPADAPFPPRNVPIVMWQEGGPGGATTSRWGSSVENPFNLLPNFGIALLVVPLAGREGHGPDFYNALVQGRNFGSIDIDEGAEIARQMIARGYTSAERLGLTGCSYGGYYTTQSITRHPDLYAAANAQCLLLDLFNEWQFGSTWYVSYLMGRAPTADPNEYVQDSPAYNATQVRTPLLIFHGTEDFLPVTIVANYHDQIKATGTPVQMLAFEGEGHGLQAPESQMIAGQAQIAWFREYLTPLAEKPVANPQPERPAVGAPPDDANALPVEATPKPARNANAREAVTRSSSVMEQVETTLQPAPSLLVVGEDQMLHAPAPSTTPPAAPTPPAALLIGPEKGELIRQQFGQ